MHDRVSPLLSLKYMLGDKAAIGVEKQDLVCVWGVLVQGDTSFSLSSHSSLSFTHRLLAPKPLPLSSLNARENTVEGNMQSQTMINSKDKRFGPKELNIINPIT